MADFTTGDYAYTVIDGPSRHVEAAVVDKTKASYADVPANVTYGGATYTVTSVAYCFNGCGRMAVPPAIPATVVDMESCFFGCSSLESAPAVPDGVTNMKNCFYLCASLAAAPAMPDSVTEMACCFYGCTSLTHAPTIPPGARDLLGCFSRCTSLVLAPDVPYGVENMSECFYGCTSLTHVASFPASVRNISACFYGCTSLESIAVAVPFGRDVRELAYYTGAFYGTKQPILVAVKAGSHRSALEPWRPVEERFPNVYVPAFNTLPSTSLSVRRCDSNGNSADQGEYACLTATVTLYEDHVPPDTNSISSSTWKADGASISPSQQSSHTGTTWTCTALYDTNDLAKHVFSFSVEDLYGNASAEITGTLVSANPALDYCHDDATGESGVGVGKVATKAGMLDVGLDASFDGDVDVAGALKAAGERCYPMYTRASWSASSDESTLPTTPCFVLDTSDMGLYFCDGN